jgi:uncharacterized repeat protein (TIGR01451 family)
MSSTGITVPINGTINIDLHMIRVLDNATIYGKVYDSNNITIAVNLEFSGTDDSAINATVLSQSDGDFTASLHPGNYTLYAVHGDDAILTNINVTAGEYTNTDIRLQKGYRLEGTLYKGSTPLSGNVTIVNRENRALIYAEADMTGKFTTRLPEARYGLSSRATFPERGIDVPYINITNIEFTDDKIVNIELKRADDNGVELYWNPSQMAKIHGNETVVYTITVNNTGNVPDGYSFTGEPASWNFEFNPSSVSMNFGDSDSSRTVDVSITSPPNALVKHEDLKITAHSQGSSAQGSVNVDVDIYQYRGIELSLGNETPVYNNSRMRYTVEIMNTGNDDDNYTLLIANKDEIELNGWKAYFNSSGNLTETMTLTISPNTKTTVEIELNAGSGALDLTILAYSAQDRGTDDILIVPLSLPGLLLDKSDIGVEGEGLGLEPPDNLAANALIVMIFATIVCIAAILLLRRKKK